MNFVNLTENVTSLAEDSNKTYGVNKIGPVFVALDNNLNADIWTVLLQEFAEHLALKFIEEEY